MKGCIKHKLPATHDEWLNDRLKGIGGSDAGAVLGLNPYKSPYTLWAEKTERISSYAPDNEAMRQGRDLEGYVAKRFEEETGKKVRKSGFSYQSKEYPFMLANVDRLVVGEDAGLECKTTSVLTKTKYDKGDIPASYYAQCMHYMAVTGASRWYIAVLILNKGFYWYSIDRNEEEIQNLIAAESDFWEMVTNNEEPIVDDSDSTSTTLEKLYPKDDGETLDLFGQENEISLYMDIKSRIKDLEKKKKEYENTFKADLGNCTFGRSDRYQMSWKQIESERLDGKRLREERPEIYDQYLKKTSFRRFEVKEIS